MTWTIAVLAVECGIPPRELLEAPEGVLGAMIRYMEQRRMEAKL